MFEQIESMQEPPEEVRPPVPETPARNPLAFQWTTTNIFMGALAALLIGFGIYFVVSFNLAKKAVEAVTSE